MENHLKKNESIHSIQIINVNSLEYTKNIDIGTFNEYSSESFVVSLPKPISRCTSIELSNYTIPSTNYNITDDGIKIDFTYNGVSVVYDTVIINQSILIGDGIYDVNSLITEINSNYTANPMGLLLVNFSYDTIYENKVFCIIDEPGITKTDGFLKFSNLLYNLGFNSLGKGFLSIVSSSSLNMNEYTVNGTNDEFILYNNELSETLILKLKHATYTLYSIAYELYRIMRQYQIGVTVSYIKYSKVLLLKFNSENNHVISVLSSQFSIDMKIVGKCKLYSFADREITYNLTDNRFRAFDYSTIVIDVFQPTTSSLYIKIPNGYYNIDEICTEITTLLSAAASFSIIFQYNTLTKKVDITFPNSTYNDNYIYPTGLSLMLGHHLYNSQYYMDYIGSLLNTPSIYSNYFNIKSKTLSILSTQLSGSDYLIWQVPNVVLNNDTQSNKYKLLLSKKENLQEFDIYITNDKDEIVELNGGNVSLSLIINRS
jgi:hypothetical protein